MEPRTILREVDKQHGRLKTIIRQLVVHESPSEDRQAVNAAVDIAISLTREQGARIKRHRQREFGDVLELHFGPERSRKRPVLLLGHLDTVWPMGTVRKMPWREAEGRFWGPGVLDMKAVERCQIV